MPDDVTTLECPKCGAGLDIYLTTETLVCHQCSLLIEVNRRGGDIALNGVAARVMEVHPWTELISAESADVKIEDSLRQLREASRLFAVKIHRRRLAFGMLNGATIGCVLLFGAWVVRDKDSGSQAAMAILLGGGVALGCLVRYLGRDSWWRYRWSKYWPWSWRPNFEEASEVHRLNCEIERLEKRLLESKP